MKTIAFIIGIFVISAVAISGCTTPSPSGPIVPTATAAITPSAIPATSVMNETFPAVSVVASPDRYSPLMSSTVGIGLAPQYSGTGPVIYHYNASFGHFVGWGAPDFKVIPYNASIDSPGGVVYWTYPPDEMGRPKPPVTIRLTVLTPPGSPGGNKVLVSKDILLTWNQTDYAEVVPGP